MVKKKITIFFEVQKITSFDKHRKVLFPASHVLSTHVWIMFGKFIDVNLFQGISYGKCYGRVLAGDI